MATTTNLGLTFPTVGASDDTWGTENNAVITGFDAVFKADGTGTSVGIKVGSGKTLNALDGTVVLGDAGLTIKDTADPTKIAAFQCSGITAGNTRTLTVPDASGIVPVIGARFFVYRSASVTNFSGDNTAIQFPLNTESEDLGGCYNTTNYEFTAPSAGKLKGGFYIADVDTTGNWQWIRIFLRGSTFGDFYVEPGFLPVAGFTVSGVSRPFCVKVAAGETVQLWNRNRSSATTKTSTLNSGLVSGTTWFGEFIPD